jgi:hypothetical protein
VPSRTGQTRLANWAKLGHAHLALDRVVPKHVMGFIGSKHARHRLGDTPTVGAGCFCRARRTSLLHAAAENLLGQCLGAEVEALRTVSAVNNSAALRMFARGVLKLPRSLSNVNAYLVRRMAVTAEQIEAELKDKLQATEAVLLADAHVFFHQIAFMPASCKLLAFTLLLPGCATCRKHAGGMHRSLACCCSLKKVHVFSYMQVPYAKVHDA